MSSFVHGSNNVWFLIMSNVLLDESGEDKDTSSTTAPMELKDHGYTKFTPLVGTETKKSLPAGSV